MVSYFLNESNPKIVTLFKGREGDTQDIVEVPGPLPAHKGEGLIKRKNKRGEKKKKQTLNT